MPDTATKSATVTAAQTAPEPTLGRPRGRHRKPRPRRTLFAVGGLALAAGALSLLRLAPQPSGGTVEATDIEPSAVSSTEETVQDNAGAVAEGDVPTACASPAATTKTGSPTATSPSGSRGGAGPAIAHPAPTPSGTLQESRPPSATTPPAQAARQPTAPKPPATTPSRPAPTPTGTPQNPAHPAQDLCVPIVGLCLDED
jgi:hypothetical protein